MPKRLMVGGAVVYDGTGGPGVAADVLVVGDRIAVVGSVSDGVDADLLDAEGLAVAPGFINVSQSRVFHHPAGSSRAVGPDAGRDYLGVWGGRVTRSRGDELGELLKGWVPAPTDQRRSWGRLSEFLAHLQQRGVTQNVASFVGAHNLRVLGADQDGLYISHLRSEGDRLMEALGELLYLGREAGVRAEVYHLKAAGRENWPKMDRAIELIDSARAAGQPVTADSTRTRRARPSSRRRSRHRFTRTALTRCTPD